MGYTMSADEVTFWQDAAALLDPDAYEFVFANSTSRTVTSGKHWFLVNGWFLDGGSNGNWFHRPADVDHALMLPDGSSISTGTVGGSTAFMYLCKPELVVENAGDDRYADYQGDPRALYFERIQRLASLTRYKVGAANTGGGQVDSTFPTDFTDGLAVHTSAHDVAWVIMLESGGGGGMNTQNEISDSSAIRFAEKTTFPFKRTTFPKIRTQGVSSGQGAGSMTYVKLPSDW